METETKRRRINLNLNDNEDGIDESEDVKMEQFFALIRKAKDIRDQLLGNEPRRMNERRQPATTTKEDKGKGKSAVWQLCFEPQDFGEEDVVVKTNDVAGCSKTPKQQQQEEVCLNKAADEQHVNIISTTPHKDGRILLDLNLSL